MLQWAKITKPNDPSKRDSGPGVQSICIAYPTHQASRKYICNSNASSCCAAMPVTHPNVCTDRCKLSLIPPEKLAQHHFHLLQRSSPLHPTDHIDDNTTHLAHHQATPSQLAAAAHNIIIPREARASEAAVAMHQDDQVTWGVHLHLQFKRFTTVIDMSLHSTTSSSSITPTVDSPQ